MMKIKERDKLPDAKVFILDKDPKEVSIKQIIGDEKTIYLGCQVRLHLHVQQNTYQDLPWQQIILKKKILKKLFVFQ